MRVRYDGIRQKVTEAVLSAGVVLPDDVRRALEEAARRQSDRTPAKKVLTRIIENLDAAEAEQLPMCQDTGMVFIWVEIGRMSAAVAGDLDAAIEQGIADAYREGSFRKSVVDEPVFSRRNTGTNLPAVIYHQIVDGEGITLNMMLKGFGSENCSGLAMLNPTAGPEGVADAVTGLVAAAGGKPCPPVIVGVGLGGTADRAMVLSKLALFRDVTDVHPDQRYADLEQELLNRINELDIGPGGLGGMPTALAVKTAAEPTHIAGLPVGVSISCWADRRVTIRFTGTDIHAEQGSAGGEDL